MASYTDRIHEVLYDRVGEAAQQVAHLDKGADEASITKKTVKAIYKSACDQELLSLPWEKACETFVQNAMSSHGSSSGETTWFYCIDLVPALAQAAVELVNGAMNKRIRPDSIHEIVHAEYEAALDKAKLEAVLWEIVEQAFSDAESKLKHKIYTALQKAYWVALEASLDDQVLHTDMMSGLDGSTEMKRLERFLQAWLSDAFGRAWIGIENGGVTFNEALLADVVRMFIAPYGEEHWMTCLPGALIENLGRPPLEWTFIRLLVGDLFAEWRGEVPKSKKRRTNSQPQIQEDLAYAAPVKQFSAFGGCAGGKARPTFTSSAGKGGKTNGVGAKGKSKGKGRHEEEEEERAGHPRCTSADDCIGCRTDQLVRHLHNGEAGDTYCQPCWDSFVDRNPALEGIYEDDN